MLFFPYEFTFDQYHNHEEAINSISEALTEDFHVAFEYRNSQMQSRYDTFMTCIYEHSFFDFFGQESGFKIGRYGRNREGFDFLATE